ncbi:MAG: hypothetical protein KAG66_18125, partial [Methylococcales bacterium]|nr:hypothetical protein [Methylococcales bacterium]
YDLGAWLIDAKKNTISVNWNYGWDSATTRLYEVDGAIKMYDINTGRWRTTLNQSIDKPQDIKTYQL